MRIYLDSDGVCFNFTKAVCTLFNVEYREPQTYEIYKMLGVSLNDFWKKIDDAGEDFWAELEPYPWFEELISKVKKIDKDFHMLTSPSRNPNCVKGKMQCFHKHFSWGFRNFIFAPAKSKKELSGPNKVLIDDRIDNIRDWEANKGYAILFPQPYNFPVYMLPDKDEIVDYVLRQLP